MLGLELGNGDGGEDLLEDCGIDLSLETVVERVEVGSRDDVLEVDRLSKRKESASRSAAKEEGDERFETRVVDRLTSSGLKTKASGARLGPLQKRVPVEVT